MNGAKCAGMFDMLNTINMYPTQRQVYQELNLAPTLPHPHLLSLLVIFTIGPSILYFSAYFC